MLPVALIPLEDLGHMRPVIASQVDDSLDIVDEISMPKLLDSLGTGLPDTRATLLVNRLLGDLQQVTSPRHFPGVDMSHLIDSADEVTSALRQQQATGAVMPPSAVADLVASARSVMGEVRAQPYMWQ